MWMTEVTEPQWLDTEAGRDLAIVSYHVEVDSIAKLLF